MTSVLLVFPKTGEEKWRKTFVPPFAVSALAYWLRKHTDWDVNLYDERVEPESRFIDLLRRCSDGSVVGFSTMTGPQIGYALKLARTAREHLPDGHIVFGGVHPSFTPEATVSHPLIDIVVRGEGEETLLETVSTLKENGVEKLKRVNGLTFELGGKIYNTPDRALIPRSSFDETGFLWDFKLLERYVDSVDGERYFSFITSRGCPYRCAFCYNHGFWHRIWRGWSVERTLNEIQMLSEHVKFDVANIFDDNFFANPRRVVEIVRNLKRLGISGWCSGGMKANQLSREMARVCKETNCRQLYIGAESGSQRILDYLQKDMKIEDMLRAAKLAREFEIPLVLTWMVGIPTETREEVFQTLDLIDRIKQIQPESGHSLAIYLPMPGAELFSEAVRYGFNPPRDLGEWTKLTFFSGGAETPLWLKTLFVCNYILNYEWQGKRKAYEILNVFRPFEMARWRSRYFGAPIEGFLYEKNILGMVR
ncbi:MAG: B12-binding domain-containing radical SAM protein [Candidatus Bathyarchaeia archaeon]